VIVVTRRLVALARALVMAVGAATALCMVVVVSLQFGFWLMTKTWSPFPVSRLFELADVNVPRRYTPASIDAPAPSRLDVQGVIETLLDLPAIVVLFVALACVALCYTTITAFDRRLADSET